MYNIGTTVIYGNEGVCRITEITEKRFKDKNIEYYVLKPVYKDDSEIYVPKNNKELLGKMREILSKEEILDLIKTMPEEESIWIVDENKRKEYYREILIKGERTELVRLIKTLYLHKQKQRKVGKKLHIADEKFLKDAEHLLYDEFAFVLSISKDEVLPFITGELEKSE